MESSDPRAEVLAALDFSTAKKNIEIWKIKIYKGPPKNKPIQLQNLLGLFYWP